MRVNITWTNRNPDTIWNRLAAKLGREPTHAEASAEVQRILRSRTPSPPGARADQAPVDQLPRS